MSLSPLPLKDAVLADVHFQWQAARCICTFQPDELETHVLIFSGVSELHVPCRQPWGPSAAVTSAREVQPGLFEIELHSGDVLRIVASTWEFRKERRATPRA